jgi:hypothetical protein
MIDQRRRDRHVLITHDVSAAPQFVHMHQRRQRHAAFVDHPHLEVARVHLEE